MLTGRAALLEGLARLPGSAEGIVEEGLRRFEAAKSIVRFLRVVKVKLGRRSSNQPKRKRRKLNPSVSVDIPKPRTESPPSSWQHWIFQALASPQLPVRQQACRILLQYSQPKRLIPVLIKCMTVSSHGDIQVVGLLLHILLLHEDCIHLPAFAWAAQTIQTSRQQQRRVLLIHLLHVLCQKQPLYVKYLWSSTQTLANLVAAGSLLAAQPPPGMESAVKRLTRLVDPVGNNHQQEGERNKEDDVQIVQQQNDEEDEAMEEEEEEVQEEEEEEEEVDEEAGDHYDEFGESEVEEDHQQQQNEEEEKDMEEDEEAGNEEERHEEEQEDEEDDEEVHERDQEITDQEQQLVDVVRHFEERLLDINDASAAEHVAESRPSSSAGPPNHQEDDHKKIYLQAGIQVLSSHYPPLLGQHQHQQAAPTIKTDILTTDAEQYLLQSMCNTVKPPKKPVNIKIFMRRAPSQEEFFRGSLTRNPVSLSHLLASKDAGAASGELTVRDLRNYIADQLQMSETAELIEILCATKILHLDLKLRLVQQVLWRTHLIENSASYLSSSLITGGGAPTFFSTGSGISMVFTSDRSERRGNITADTPASDLPPMVVTYRLAGVDGEATEDHVDDLEDPEAPSAAASPGEEERLLEKEFGLTRLVTDGRGINVLLRSIQSHVRDSLRRIRRDDVIFKRVGQGKRSEKNNALLTFERSPPFSGLLLLKHCTKLPSNRKKLVDARAPTILLRLLLDVLNAIDDSSSTEVDTSSDQNAQVVNNPTAVMLEELIETLASDISTDDDGAEDEEMEEGASTLPLLLNSLRTIYLGPQLRKVIAKLLPFLTYGQSSLARELAEKFSQHIKVEKLTDCEAKEQPKTRRFVLMDTFVQAAVCLPPNDVCNSLRTELMKSGFVEKLIAFILEDMPDQPPPWSAALWPKVSPADRKGKEDVTDLEQSWKYYFLRSGIKTAFDMLAGLCRGHAGIQALVASYGEERRFITVCHWIESTSDNKTVRISLNGLGLVAETLLDEVKENNDDVAKAVGDIRHKTRERKKEIADERRSKALVSMSAFGPIAGGAEERSRRNINEERTAGVSSAIRSSASSVLAPLLDFFNPNASGTDVSNSATASKSDGKPAWLVEMEALEDETGLTCAVCQEGRNLAPSELLGLYCYVKKVSISHNKGGGRSYIDGSMLLISLPDSLPTSLVGTTVEDQWYIAAKASGDYLRRSQPHLSSSTSNVERRPSHFTTTVSAGNAIHCSCHSRARSADRNHPKAPKSEWEGASLRNSRVSCNVILPLVSSKSSKVPLLAADMALTDYQTTIANMLGARPKSMLWVVLNDVRFLLLRIAYGEALNADCGGGSLSANLSLLFHELILADMFANDAEHDSPETAKHARCLSGGYLAAYMILESDDFDGSPEKICAMTRAFADAAPMAALTCILFHNTKDENSSNPDKDAVTPHPERRWDLNKDIFWSGLIACAGRRHALGVEDSGCVSSRKGRTSRQSSFSDWEVVDHDEGPESSSTAKRKGLTSVLGKRGVPSIDDFAMTLRPMVTLYVIFDALSSVYVPCLTDEMIEESSALMVKRVEECQAARGIHDLLRKAGITLDHDRIMDDLQKGMISA